MFDWTKYDSEIKNTILRFKSDINNYDEKYIENLVNDILQCVKVYNITYTEYFYYGFENLSDEIKKTYVTTDEYKNTLLNCIKEDKIPVYKNKYSCYEELKSFYKRDIIKVTDFSDYNNFVQFVLKHKKYIIKVIDGSLGAKVSVVNVTEKDNPKNLFFYALGYGGCIIEEFIDQDPVFAAFNKSSVNTIRLTTVCDDGKVNYLFSLAKFGRDNAVVDNAGQGGIISMVDTETGEVISDGYDELLNVYFKHPNSNLDIKGFRIPRWNELLEFSESAAKSAQGITVIGWDFALTDKGWDVIEANTFPSIFPIQMLMNKTYDHGIRERYNAFLQKYSHNKKVNY